MNNVGFSMTESKHFLAFLNFVNPYADEILPLSGITVRKDLTVAIRLRLSDVKKALAQAQSEIHLIYDGRTSANRMSLFGN